MRTFEIVLIIINIISLFFYLKLPPKYMWYFIAGTNLLMLSIHGIWEGFRYQRTFSYLLVMLVVLYSIFKLKSNRVGIRKWKVTKIIIAGFSCLFIMATTLLAYSLPVFALPEPTGDHTVGVEYLKFMDEEREDPFLDGAEQNRELMVKIYYPSKPGEAKSYSFYFHSPELLTKYAAFYNMPGFLFDHLNLVKTNSKEKASVSTEQKNIL
ncbi:hypothetical protein P4J13_25835 [Bacillus anthracis]|uniref:hypothetical protein n=1 Tax=Bacillus anthracis TaxID=1392 RepID=UPI002DBDC28D|nr:hypothetical protein [Bacillus anthracis]MEB9507351.1 hypothetical protein [Bacillus anthracis]